MKNKRRDFLKNVCPTVALAFFGVTMLEACSSGGDDSEIPSGGGGSNNDKGYTVSGNTVVITLSNSNFSSLNSNGWINFGAEGYAYSLKLMLLHTERLQMYVLTKVTQVNGVYNTSAR